MLRAGLFLIPNPTHNMERSQRLPRISAVPAVLDVCLKLITAAMSRRRSPVRAPTADFEELAKPYIHLGGILNYLDMGLQIRCTQVA